jgi:putative addiction module component (TIGR02574 family)
MNMSIDQIASEALRLPARERALLAGSLWESLEDPSAASVQMDDAAIAALALERDREIETGQVQAVSHDEMMAKLRR